MKKIVSIFSLLLPLFLLQQNLFAQIGNNKKYPFVKNKVVNKLYNISSTDKLKIKNSFGDVQVHTWDKNEIKVDITIEVSATTEITAQKLIDNISIKDSKSSNQILFTTVIKGPYNSKKASGIMKVNYSVYMPSSNPLQISNYFGSIILPDYSGEIELVNQWGSVTAGALTNVKSIMVEFGKAKLSSVTNGVISIRFSSGEIDKLLGKIALVLQNNTLMKLNLDNNLTALDAKILYTTVNLKPTEGFSASYNIVTQYAKFKNKTNISFNHNDDDDDFTFKINNTYTAKSGSGNTVVKINSNFGKIVFGDATTDDMKEKEKNSFENPEIIIK